MPERWNDLAFSEEDIAHESILKWCTQYWGNFKDGDDCKPHSRPEITDFAVRKYGPVHSDWFYSRGAGPWSVHSFKDIIRDQVDTIGDSKVKSSVSPKKTFFGSKLWSGYWLKNKAYGFSLRKMRYDPCWHRRGGPSQLKRYCLEPAMLEANSLV